MKRDAPVIDLTQESSPKKRRVEVRPGGFDRAHHCREWQTLTVDQREAAAYIFDNPTASVFITGEAGSGKTRLLRYIIAEFRRRGKQGGLFVTAFTGAAALLLDGRTLNSFAGIGLADQNGENTMKRMTFEARLRWQRACTLIIDEISMTKEQTLNLLDFVARAVRRRPNLPFGGVRLILAGDIAQLPPVTKAPEQQHFCFESAAWRALAPRVFNFTYSHRQANQPEFISLLADMRLGVCTPSNIEALRQCLGRTFPPEELVTYLFPHRDPAAKMNAEKLAKLPGKMTTFVAVDYAKDDNEKYRGRLKDIRAPIRLDVKPGAQVLLLKNLNLEKGLVNGTVATITRITSTTIFIRIKGRDDRPSDDYDEEADIEITTCTFEVKEDDVLIASRTQFPLILAYALTIHVVQGQTITGNIVADMGNIFEYGQAYVLLSRIQRLEQLSLLSFNPTAIRAHDKVVEFYESIRNPLILGFT
jgi:ATP-dependent DNA helicase PIF1